MCTFSLDVCNKVMDVNDPAATEVLVEDQDDAMILLSPFNMFVLSTHTGQSCWNESRISKSCENFTRFTPAALVLDPSVTILLSA